jgi:benzoyl-CoA reductase/2-hydroxyglutaryl-CoA dehydratase subunit BcrC/BadD/HgdB
VAPCAALLRRKEILVIQAEFNQILFDPLESTRQLSREGHRVIGCLDSYVPEEFIHAMGMVPVRLLGSSESITLADAHLPIFAGQQTRSIFNQGLKGNLSHLAGIALSNSSDAIRTLYDLWQRHIPGQWSALVDVPAILEGEANHRLFRSAMLNFIKALEGLAGHSLDPAALRRSITVYNENRRLLKKAASLLGGSPQHLSAETYLDAVLSGFLISKERHNALLSDLLKISSGAPAVSGQDLLPLHMSGPILVDRSFLPLLRQCGATMTSEDLGTGSRYYWDEVDETGDPVEEVINRYWGKIPESYKLPMEPRWLHLTARLEGGNAKGAVFVVERYSDEDQYDYPIFRDRLQRLGIPSLELDTEFVLGSEQARTRIQTFVDIVKGRAD